MAKARKFDTMHENAIRYLFVTCGLSERQVARVMGTSRANITFVRKRMGIEANFRSGKRWGR